MVVVQEMRVITGVVDKSALYAYVAFNVFPAIDAYFSLITSRLTYLWDFFFYFIRIGVAAVWHVYFSSFGQQSFVLQEAFYAFVAHVRSGGSFFNFPLVVIFGLFTFCAIFFVTNVVLSLFLGSFLGLYGVFTLTTVSLFFF